jgi:uncharacterized integral membrane protein
MKAKSIIAVILLVLILVVIFQNTEVVSFRFLFWQISMSRIIWLLLVLIIGFAAGYFMRTVGRAAKGGKGEDGS